MKVTLELVDSQLLTLATLVFMLPLKHLSFKEVVIAIKRHFFDHYYNKYKLFGSNNYSNHKFHHFDLITCNNVSVGDLLAVIPEGQCQIVARAKSIENKNIHALEQNQFEAKLNGITETTALNRKKKSINNKNKNNKLKKLQKKFGRKFSYDKFYQNKLQQKEIQESQKRLKKVKK